MDTDDISSLRQLAGTPLMTPAIVRPAPAYRVERSTWTDTPMPPDEPLGANPPAGAIIDYFLPAQPKRPIELEILDSTGNLVRRYKSDDPLEPTEEELARELIPSYWIATPASLPANRGMHRWIWDLHYPSPDTTAKGYPISAVPHGTPRGPLGPLALPGNYVIRLTVDGHRIEAPLILRADPRVPVPTGALEQQFALASTLAESLSESSRAVRSAQSEHEQLQALVKKRPADDAIVSYDQKLSALLSAKEAPSHETKDEATVLLPDLQEQIEMLYNEVLQGDAAPNAALVEASEAARNKLTSVLRTWNQLQTQLPDLNKRLRSAKMPPVRADLAPTRDLNVADED